jgi:hypothetical protein
MRTCTGCNAMPRRVWELVECNPVTLPWSPVVSPLRRGGSRARGTSYQWHVPRPGFVARMGVVVPTELPRVPSRQIPVPSPAPNETSGKLERVRRTSAPVGGLELDNRWGRAALVFSFHGLSFSFFSSQDSHPQVIPRDGRMRRELGKHGLLATVEGVMM